MSEASPDLVIGRFVESKTTSASPFDAIKRVRPDGSEYWYAREVMPLLGYTKWQAFQEAIERATTACQKANHSLSDHFTGTRKVIPGGRWGHQSVKDYVLSRYACYLVAMNGDPCKPEIAAAQTYFAIRTRQAEQAAEAEQVLLDMADDEIETPSDGLLRASEMTTQAIRRLVQQERQTRALARRQLALKAQQDQLEAKQEQMKEQVATLLAVQQKAVEELTALPLCPTPAAPRTPRDCINEIVRNYALRTCSDSDRPDFGGAYSKLYREVYFRLHIDLKQRAANSNRKPLDVAEEVGIIEQVWAIASEVLSHKPASLPPS